LELRNIDFSEGQLRAEGGACLELENLRRVRIAENPYCIVRRTQMDAIRATVKSGRLELDAPPDWPEGTEVFIEPMNTQCEKIGIDESEWSDSPASLADWQTWIQTIEPLEFTPEESRTMADFDNRMRQYNVEAVRRQMQERPQK
jgi:hypothetical protein